jgi:hypothetical protein
LGKEKNRFPPHHRCFLPTSSLIEQTIVLFPNRLKTATARGKKKKGGKYIFLPVSLFPKREQSTKRRHLKEGGGGKRTRKGFIFFLKGFSLIFGG